MADLACNRVRDAFRSGRVPAEQEPHVSECEECRALLAAGGRLGLSLGALPRPSPDELGGLRAAVLSRVRHEVGLRSRLRSLSRGKRLLGVSVVLLALTCGVLLLKARPNLWSAELWLVWGTGAVYLGGILVGLRELIGDPSQRVQPLERLRLALSLALVPAAMALGAGLSPDVEGQVPPGSFVKQAASCFVFGASFSLAMLCCLWLIERADRPSGSAALLAGVCAGLFGNFAAHWHCPSTEAGHLLLGHASVLPLVAFAYVRAMVRRVSHLWPDQSRP